MRRRLLLLALVLALAVGLPVAVAAQNSEAVWDLTENLTFTDLGFNVYYPEGWVYGATNGSGVFFAETEDDLAQVTDDDPNTLGTSNTMQFIGTEIEALAEVVGSDAPTLEEIAAFVMESRGITESEPPVEVPVMSRRSYSILGEDAAGQGWILTVWKQGDFAIGAFLTSPDYDETVRVAFSWGQVLANILPNDPLRLDKGTVPLPTVGAEFNYPEDWFVDPDNANIVYELESDYTDDSSEGFLLIGIEQSLEDLELDDDATLEDVVEANIAILELTEPVRHEEFIMLDQPAIVIRGTDGSDQYALLAHTIVDGVVVQIGVISPDEKSMDAFEPTFVAMLKTLRISKGS